MTIESTMDEVMCYCSQTHARGGAALWERSVAPTERCRWAILTTGRWEWDRPPLREVTEVWVDPPGRGGSGQWLLPTRHGFAGLHYITLSHWSWVSRSSLDLQAGMTTSGTRGPHPLDLVVRTLVGDRGPVVRQLHSSSYSKRSTNRAIGLTCLTGQYCNTSRTLHPATRPGRMDADAHLPDAEASPVDLQYGIQRALWTTRDY
jgi:hypothetical protein